MIEQLPQSSGKILGFKLSGKLHDEDYKLFVPVIDTSAQAGKIRLLAWFENFQGWDMQALWDDIRFATGHCTTFDRIALVGDKAWEKWMAAICKPFTRARLQYFDVKDIDAAWKWLEEETSVVE